MTFFLRMIIFLIFNSHSPSCSYETYCTRKIIIYSEWFSWIINKVHRIELTSSLFRLLFAFTTWRFELQSSFFTHQLVITVTVILVTLLCWWLYDGDWIEMLEAESLRWRLFSSCRWFSNVLNRSSTSQTCHQHIWSPTSVTNINELIL